MRSTHSSSFPACFSFQASQSPVATPHVKAWARTPCSMLHRAFTSHTTAHPLSCLLHVYLGSLTVLLSRIVEQRGLIKTGSRASLDINLAVIDDFRVKVWVKSARLTFTSMVNRQPHKMVKPRISSLSANCLSSTDMDPSQGSRLPHRY